MTVTCLRSPRWISRKALLRVLRALCGGYLKKLFSVFSVVRLILDQFPIWTCEPEHLCYNKTVTGEEPQPPRSAYFSGSNMPERNSAPMSHRPAIVFSFLLNLSIEPRSKGTQALPSSLRRQAWQSQGDFQSPSVQVPHNRRPKGYSNIRIVRNEYPRRHAPRSPIPDGLRAAGGLPGQPGDCFVGKNTLLAMTVSACKECTKRSGGFCNDTLCFEVVFLGVLCVLCVLCGKLPFSVISCTSPRALRSPRWISLKKLFSVFSVNSVVRCS